MAAEIKSEAAPDAQSSAAILSVTGPLPASRCETCFKRLESAAGLTD